VVELFLSGYPFSRAFVDGRMLVEYGSNDHLVAFDG